MVTIGLDSPPRPSWVWQSAALATTLLLTAACGPGQKPAARVERREPEPPPPVWHRFEDVASWQVVTRPFRSEHLMTARDALTRASPEAALPYLDLVAGAQLPVASALVEALSAVEGAPATEYLVMERTAQAWTYLLLDGEGRPVANAAADCQRCHQEALSDELFGAGAARLDAPPAE